MRTLLRLIAPIISSCVIGCSSNSPTRDGHTSELSPQVAKDCLVAMLSEPEAGKSLHPMTQRLFDNLRKQGYIDALRNKIPDASKYPVVRIGGWRCDLDQQSFDVNFEGHVASQLIHGSFVQEADGSWTARLDSVDIGCTK